MSDNNMQFTSFTDIMEKAISSEEMERLEYWDTLSKLIIESINLRTKHNLSQRDIALKLKTTQSVISRFENMGRRPNYDFLVRMAKALDGKLSITFEGDYVVKAMPENKELIDFLSKDLNTSKAKIMEEALDIGLKMILREHSFGEKKPQQVSTAANIVEEDYEEECMMEEGASISKKNAIVTAETGSEQYIFVGDEFVSMTLAATEDIDSASSV